MPQATVKLQQTKPLSQAPTAEVKSAAKPAPTTQVVEESAESAAASGGIALPAAMLVFSAIVFGLQLWTFLTS